MLHSANQDCASESGLDEEVIEKALDGNLPEDEKLKKHVLCVGKKMGFVNEEGEIQVDVVKEKLGDSVDDAEELVKKCVEDKGNAEDTAFNFAKCAYEMRSSA